MRHSALLRLLVLFVLSASWACDDAATADPPVIDVEPEVVVLEDLGIDAALPDAAVDPVDAAPLPLAPLPAIIGPAAAEDLDPAEGIVEIELRAGAFTLPIAEDLNVQGYGYNGQFPGPVIQARVGDDVVVRFTNDLAEPTTVHWHGLRISDEMDGSPRVQAPVAPGETFTYRFTVPDAGTFWFHPHVRSNEQVEKGLYGMFVVHEAEPPVFAAERAFVLDDILLDGDQIPGFLQTHPEVMHGRSGNVLLTNGRAALDAGDAEMGDVERWRLVNVANARTMNLTIEGARFRVIGVDGGLLAEPYETPRLQVAVGQRYDLEVRYAQPGAVRLISHIPVVENGAIVERGFDLQAINVAASDRTPMAVELPSVERPARGQPDRTVRMVFDTVPDARTGQRWRINGLDMPEEPIFTFQRDEYVRITLVNDAAQEHPFHLHGQFFEIFPDGTPETEQPGLKDTVLVAGDSTVHVLARLSNPGRWMAHCHILEHAEVGMMAEILVEEAP